MPGVMTQKKDAIDTKGLGTKDGACGIGTRDRTLPWCRRQRKTSNCTLGKALIAAAQVRERNLRVKGELVYKRGEGSEGANNSDKKRTQ